MGAYLKDKAAALTKLLSTPVVVHDNELYQCMSHARTIQFGVCSKCEFDRSDKAYAFCQNYCADPKRGPWRKL